MEIIDFTHAHIEEAIKIAKANYDEERVSVPILPQVDTLPDLTLFADNKLGVATFENGIMTGYLCCYNPRPNHFGKTLGTFSPVHAHGAVKYNRKRIYSYLYQAAARKWVSKGILSHAIALYTHDSEAMESFFWNGFGLRCVDAIRPLEPLSCTRISNYNFRELPKEECLKIFPMKNKLISHLNASPMFIPIPQYTAEHFCEEIKERNSRIFAAEHGEMPIAYIEIMDSGENFACDDKSMMNICGAFCMSEHRNIGVYSSLLSYLCDTLISEGFTRLGVDFESFNPTARGFWTKYFTPYTGSVVRKIDERIVEM